jgi:hypothetical protein
MEDIVTIEAVKNAIHKLKGEGERVTRRNVLAVTGGSMSTVHRMMGQIEDMEAKTAASTFGGISESLSNDIREEVARNIKGEIKLFMNLLPCCRTGKRRLWIHLQPLRSGEGSWRKILK